MINISPGPAMMFVRQESQTNRVKAGLVAALGIEIGVFIDVILTAFGISTLFKEYPSVYNGLQLIGDAYLFYIAYLGWPWNKASSDATTEFRRNHRGTLLKGLLINLTNPKIALFFLSLIPQFVPQGSNSMTFVLYGLIFNVGGILLTQ